MKSFRQLTLVALGLATGPLWQLPARATELGFSTDPAQTGWDRGDAGTGYAIWDSFPSFTFSNAPSTSGSGISGATLSQSGALTVTNQGAGLYDVLSTVPAAAGQPGDVLFAGGNNVSFAVGGTVSFTIRGVVLQIKRPGSTGTLADASGFTPLLKINGSTAGIAADAIGLVSATSGDTSSSAGSYSVTTWYWNTSLAALPNVSSESFSIDFGRSPLNRGLDGVVVDVGSTPAVPEPSTALSVLGGCLLLIMFRPRRMSRGWAA